LFSKQLQESDAEAPLVSPEIIRESALSNAAPLPSLESIKDFARFYIAQSTGRITKNGRATLDSTKTFMEWFFAGFTRVTATDIDEEDRSEIYTVSTSFPCRGQSSSSALARPQSHAGNS
jgi:hypothetical protein